MVALYTVRDNFVRQHKAHKLLPALAAGLSDRLWSMEGVAALVEAAAPQCIYLFKPPTIKARSTPHVIESQLRLRGLLE
jgi:hypothetical protein